MPTYQIIEATPDSKIGYQPYGAAADLWMCKHHEVVISGPAETGKTLGVLQKLDALAWKYPGFQGGMIRKTYKSMIGSILPTYEKKVLGAWDERLNNGEGGFNQTLTPVTKYGNNKPEWFDYPHGSRLWVGGMDNPTKVLSSERDAIAYFQAEESTLEEWETLGTRATGRAGNMPYAQIMGDCNPGGRLHWILERANEGKLTLFKSRHVDNPTLFDPNTGELTAQGQRTMAVLDALSGVRYQRLRLGKWVSAEGQIYEDWEQPKQGTHLIGRFDIPDSWRRFRVIDFGLVHPFVCQWWALDEDERLYMYREIYMTGRTVATHSQQIKALSVGEQIEATVCDHDAEDRQTLAENGIPNIAAKKDVLQGIGKVQDRLKVQPDGRPRLFILRDSLAEIDQALKMEHRSYSTEQEIEGYIWANNQTREQPVKEDDHGCDTMRYAVMYVDGPSQWRRIKFLSTATAK